MKNYGQITEDKDIINKKYADTLNASSLHKSGDEVAEGQKTFNGKVLIKNLTLNTERPWTFEQSNTGANTTLDLKSEFDGKAFRITSPLKTKGISIAQSETGENNWLAPIADNVTDLGRNSYKWRNLYIKGNISDGTNSVNVGSIVTKNNKRYVNYDNYFSVNTSGKYGKLFVSDKLTQSWDSITLIFEISDKNGVNNTRGVARYSITYRGNGTNAPGLKVTRLFGDANYDSVLFINYVSTPYVDANSNYFEIYYLGSYDNDDTRKFQVISYTRRSSEEVGYTLNKGTLENLDEITSIGTVSNFTDIVLVYYCSKNQPATITGAWKFNNAKFNVSGEDYRAPLTSPAVENSDKRYLVGVPALSSKYSNTNTSCYMENGILYSNGSQVVNLADDQTMTGQKSLDKALIKKLTINTDSPWRFAQYGSGSTETLDFVPNSDAKTFRIVDPFRTSGVEFRFSHNNTQDNISPLIDKETSLGLPAKRWRQVYTNGISDGTTNLLIRQLAKKEDAGGVEISITGTSGTLSDSDWQLLADNLGNYINCDGEIFRSSYFSKAEDIIIYTNANKDSEGNQVRSYINIGYTSKAWTKTTETVGGGGGTGSSEVVISAPASATSGTITQSELNILQANDDNYILLNNEIYRLADKQTEQGYLVYTHTGQDITGNYFIKCLTITISTLGWVMTSKQQGIKEINFTDYTEFRTFIVSNYKKINSVIFSSLGSVAAGTVYRYKIAQGSLTVSKSQTSITATQLVGTYYPQYRNGTIRLSKIDQLASSGNDEGTISLTLGTSTMIARVGGVSATNDGCWITGGQSSVSTAQISATVYYIE